MLTQLTAEAGVEILVVLLAFEKAWYEKLEAFTGGFVTFGRSIEGAHCLYAMVDGTNA